MASSAAFADAVEQVQSDTDLPWESGTWQRFGWGQEKETQQDWDKSRVQTEGHWDDAWEKDRDQEWKSHGWDQPWGQEGKQDWCLSQEQGESWGEQIWGQRADQDFAERLPEDDCRRPEFVNIRTQLPRAIACRGKLSTGSFIDPIILRATPPKSPTPPRVPSCEDSSTEPAVTVRKRNRLTVSKPVETPPAEKRPKMMLTAKWIPKPIDTATHAEQFPMSDTAVPEEQLPSLVDHTHSDRSPPRSRSRRTYERTDSEDSWPSSEPGLTKNIQTAIRSAVSDFRQINVYDEYSYSYYSPSSYDSAFELS